MDMMKMMKQAAGMQKEIKKKQKILSSRTVEYTGSGGAVTVAMGCDLNPASVRIDSELIQTGNVKKIETAVLDALKGALTLARDEAAKEMKSVASGLNLPF